MLPLTPVTNNIGGPTGNRTPNAGVTGQNYYRLTTGPKKDTLASAASALPGMAFPV